MVIGYFDYAVLALLIFANVRYDQRRSRWAHGCLVGIGAALVFGLGLPWLSTLVELARLDAFIHHRDSVELLYTYLKYPWYWALFACQVAVVLFRTPKTGPQA